MICRSELKQLQGHYEYPSISVLAPMHRTAPGNKKDPIVIKNLVAKGIDRLHKEFKKREVASLVKNLTKLADKIDYQHSLDGVALFASKDTAVEIPLPFRVKPRVMIDATFATRDLVYTLNRAPRYRVLVLTEKPTRLFEATTRILVEVTDKPFPMVHSGPGGATRLPGRVGVNPSAIRDEAHRQFFRQVDEALAAIQKQDPLPIVLVGVERYLAFYQEISQFNDAIVGMVQGSHDKPNLRDLGKLVWPVFQAGATLGRMRSLTRLKEAVSANRHASGIAQVWRAGFEKKIQALLVETDFRYPADLAPEGDHLVAYTGKGPAALDDAVDELIERTMADGGEVFFHDPGMLEVHQQIAAILRY